MKRFMSAAMIGLLLLSGAAFAQKTGSQTVVFTLTVSVSPTVAGTVIKVDGTEIKGNSVSVRAGSHPIQVSAPGYEPFATVATVRADMVVNVSLVPSGGVVAPVPTTAPASIPLTIAVNVKGATVMVDGIEIRSNPVALSPGRHTVAAQAGGFRPWSQVIDLNAPLTLSITLEPDRPASYNLTVSIPGVRGATVWVDGVQMVRNPLPVAAGNHTVKASAPGYQTWEQTVTVNGDMNLTIPLTAQTFDLTVSIPGVRGATVWVDGVQMVRNPLPVAAGNHTVKASAPGYQAWEQTVAVNGNMTLTIPLTAQSFDLTVSIPGVRGASVWVDGVQMLRNPLPVSAGEHTVKASAPGYQTWEQKVAVNGNMTLTIPLTPQTFPVTFTSDVKGIELLVDGVQQKSNPVQLSPGPHSVRARARGYSDFTQDITVSGPMKVAITMRQRNAVLIIDIKDFGSEKDEKGPRGDRAKAFGQYDVWVDGKPVKMNQDRVEVAPGKHKITIAVAGLRSELEMSFEAGLQYLVEPVLTVKATPGVYFDEFMPSPSPVIFAPSPEPADLFSGR